MAKKITIKDYENKKNKKERNKLVLTIQILLIIFGVSLISNVLLVKKCFDYRTKTITAKEDYVTTIITSDRNGNPKEVRYNPPLSKEEKSKFLDDNVVFILDDNDSKYYYSYDCLAKKVGDNNFSYWAYNKSAAKSKGYKEFSC